MNSLDLERFLREGLKLLKVKRLSNGWIEAACPFSSQHSGGRDKSPSFGVRVGADRPSHYRCQGCHAKGSLTDLVWRLADVLGGETHASDIFNWVIKNDYGLIGAARYLHEREGDKGKDKGGLPPYPATLVDVPYVAPEAKIQPLVALDSPVPLTLPEEDLVGLQDIPPEVLRYLQGPKRKLTLDTIRIWEIGFGGRRISIPIRDYEKRLVGISGRLFEEEDRIVKGPKYLHSRGFRRDFFLYGEHMISPGGVGYVVEGFFDVIGLWQSGYMNGVGIMGSYPSEHQIEKMVKFFSSVVVIGDGDKAGREMAKKTHEALKPYLPVQIAPIPDGMDPDELTAEEKLDLLGPPCFDNRTVV